METADFDACGQRYMHSNESAMLQELYGWTGNTRALPNNPSTQISTQGCIKLCGRGVDYWAWDQSSNTITTWVLPTVGILVQAPFISNAFWETMFSIARWIGSPIASLAYVLWNIKVSGKCALMADMAVPYNDSCVDPNSAHPGASMRDSLYILSTMNQYSISSRLIGMNRLGSKPAEGLLRIALFSKDLRLLKRQPVNHELEHDQPVAVEPISFAASLAHELRVLDRTNAESRLEPPDELDAIRQKLAQQLRETRKRGVVPVFISMLWFVFALGISIQSSFGHIGENATAHDLALGCLVAWLPVLILCSIVDRNPISAKDSRRKLNRFIDHVRKSLMDKQVRTMFVNTIDAVAERSDMRRRVEEVSEYCVLIDGVPFFDEFAGQGRVRWHYGAAHPILCDIEDAYVAGQGRFWLRDEARARRVLVLGKRTGGLDWFDWRELWQVAASVICVCGTVFGAWTLSFFTPTIGLGCRSGGYTVFVLAALGLIIIEMVLWWWWDASKYELRDFQRRASSHHNIASNTARLLRLRRACSELWRGFEAACSELWRGFEATCSAWIVSVIKLLLPSTISGDVIQCLRSSRDNMKELTPQQAWEYFFFRPLEIANTSWLLYRAIAQTVGLDNTCECMSSIWAGGGGYIDFTQWNNSTIAYVKKYWIIGTVVAVTIMSVAMAYIVIEYCMQSHLSTANPRVAALGLQRVRRFRRLTFPARWLYYRFDDVTHSIEDAITKKFKAWGILSPAYELRPIGLRWSKEDLPLLRVQPFLSHHGNRHRAESGTPLLRATSADLPKLVQPVLPAHSARPSNAGAVSFNQDSHHMLSPNMQWSPPERQSSSDVSSRQSQEISPTSVTDIA